MNWLKKTWVLLLSLAVFILCATGFTLMTPHVGPVSLDNISSVEKVHDVLSQMSASQKQMHFMMTSIVDMIFPLAYGCLLAGLALRFLGKAGKWLGIPALITMLADLSENGIQLMALRGNELLLPVKAIITPVKTGFFALAVLIALSSVILGIVQRVRQRNQAQAA